MISKVSSSTLQGVDGKIVTVECDSSKSLPTIVIVGLGTKAIDEAKERVRSAIKHSGLEMPIKRLTLNLAPADITKDGAGFDLAMALAILAQSGQIESDSMNGYVFIGELGLDGSLRSVRGIIGHMLAARKAGFKGVVIPYQHKSQAELLDGIEVLAARSLKDVYSHFTSQVQISKLSKKYDQNNVVDTTIDMADIRGHTQAKRALEIACIGRHNVLLTGPPGSGKSMLAKSILGLLPGLSGEEALQVSQLHSLSVRPDALFTTRPFRAPHHSASHVAMLGGGKPLRPGEVSLAHKGVLFLDELPEFGRLSLEGLRQPLEDDVINVTRVDAKLTFPAEFMLVATQNPCPCGHYGDSKNKCVCSPHRIESYTAKLSGPLLDRFDIVLHIESINAPELIQQNNFKAETSADIRKRILPIMGSTNSLSSSLQLKDFQDDKLLGQDVKSYLTDAAQSLNLSTRAYLRCLRVSLSIARLDGNNSISKENIAEALQYRLKQSNYV